MNPADLVEALSAALPELHRAIALAGDPSAGAQERVAAANGFADSLGDLWSVLEAAGPAVGELLAVLDMAVGGLPDRAAAGRRRFRRAGPGAAGPAPGPSRRPR